MQNKLHTIFSQPDDWFAACPRAAIVETMGFPEVTNFVDFVKLMNFT